MKRLFSLFILFIFFSCEKETLVLKEKPPIKPPCTECDTNNVIRVACDTNNAAWFQAVSGLTRFNGSLWNKFDLASEGIALKDIRGFYSKGNDFFIYTNFGYVHYNASGDPSIPLEKVNKASAGFYNDTILSMLVTDRTWISYSNGISFLYNNKWVHQHDTLITGFAISNDTCYVATEGLGVSRYKYTADGFTGASNYFYGYGCLIDNTVYSILIAKSKVQWYGTASGVYMHPENGFRTYWQNFTKADGLPDTKITRLYEDKSNRIWALSDSGVAYYDGTQFNSYMLNGIQSLAEDNSGNMWFASSNGLGFYDGTWKIFTIADGLSDNHVNCVSASSDGSVWIGTKNGATHYKDGKYTVYRAITQN
jgi:ligand-binding sensor domain-containing protein